MTQYHIDSCEKNTFLGWFGGNIRRKLTLFVAIILVMVMGLFWVFTVYMLQPAYQNSIRSGLNTAMETVANIVNSMEADGIPIVTYTPIEGSDNLALVSITQEFADRLNNALTNGTLNLNSRCLDIADQSLQNVLLVDNIDRCSLHPSHERLITTEGLHVLSDNNSAAIVRLRQRVLTTGAVDSEESGQFVMGTATAAGGYSIIVSANLERIPQAVSVLKRLLLPLSIIIGLFAVLAVWVFSRWFARPINKLSVAAREMAKGNYDVRVEDCGTDEIGELGRDFNSMAREVARSAELQRDLIANVSHDLRTPLTLIKGYAETVRDLTGNDEQKRTEQLNVIVDESDRLSALVGSVMELSRMSSGTEKPEPVRFDLTELCDEVSARYEDICRQSGNSFVFEGEEGCLIDADADLMERALHNLLGNAMNHVGADGFIGLKVYKTGYGMVRCEVSDHGPGISEQDLPHIFDRYYRSRADTGKPGTGLGLSITKAIFDAHGFDFGVTSKPDQGATFWFEAKQADAPAPKPGTEAKQNTKRNAKQNPKG